MWVFTNQSFLSIVAHTQHPGMLLVRARFPGHIEAAFPGHAVKETPEADYRYRAAVPRKVVSKWLADQAGDVGYPNFKASIKDGIYHDACLSVWTEMYIAGKKLASALMLRRAPPA